MKFELEHVFAVDPERLWASLMDVHVVAACITGASEVEELGPDHYAGTLQVKMGPVALSFGGEVRVTLRDGENYRGELEASAKDGRAGGGFTSVLTMKLTQTGDSTMLSLELDSTVLGKIGEFGQPLIRRRIERMLKEFAGRLEAVVLGGNP